MKAIKWTAELLSTVPDDLLYSELARRRGRLRKTYSGGKVWKAHNPETKRCRCAECNAQRATNEQN